MKANSINTIVTTIDLMGWFPRNEGLGKRLNDRNLLLMSLRNIVTKSPSRQAYSPDLSLSHFYFISPLLHVKPKLQQGKPFNRLKP
jgi:hypothetical protein